MRLGLIGGTGVDEMEGFAQGVPKTITTKWGDAAILESAMASHEVVFLPRHGLGHSVPPALINYRAQIGALRQLNVDAVISVCAVGSLGADLLPGAFAVLTDFIDLTRRRTDTFFDSPDGPVVHTDFTLPYCPRVSAAIRNACSDVGAPFSPAATYIGVDGPRYESPAEIRLYASWGGDVIGMTNLPEVVLAREAGLCYGAIGVVTNFACGISPTPLNHEEVRAAMAKAAGRLQEVVQKTIAYLPGSLACECGSNGRLVI